MFSYRSPCVVVLRLLLIRYVDCDSVSDLRGRLDDRYL